MWTGGVGDRTADLPINGQPVLHPNHSWLIILFNLKCFDEVVHLKMGSQAARKPTGHRGQQLVVSSQCHLIIAAASKCLASGCSWHYFIPVLPSSNENNM